MTDIKGYKKTKQDKTMSSINKLKVLIIGGTGITSTDVSILASKTENIDLYLLNRGRTKNSIPPNIKIIKSNIKHPKFIIKSKLKGLYFDAICDFISYSKEDLLHKLNIFKGIYKQYIFISSCSVYRDNYKVPKIKTEINSPRGNILWPYGWDKYLCEEALREAAAEHDFAYTIIRPSITCDDRYFFNGWTLNDFYSWTFADRLINGKPLVMPDGGEQLCSLLHTQDFALALVNIFGNKKAYNEDYNVTGSEYVSYKDVAKIQAELLGVSPKFVDIPAEELYFIKPELLTSGLLGKIMAKSFGTCYDSSKIKKIIPEFKQNISVRKMTERVLKYYEAHPENKMIHKNFNRMFDEIAHKFM
jgi:nucleoside-diphosphate-sugar epimerase